MDKYRFATDMIREILIGYQRFVNRKEDHDKIENTYIGGILGAIESIVNSDIIMNESED